MIYDDYLINDVSVLLVNDEELFTDEEIARVVESVDSINHALYILYTQKAGKVVNSNTAIKSITAGAETIEKLHALELQKAALTMAEYYKKLWQEEEKEKAGNTGETGSSTFLY